MHIFTLTGAVNGENCRYWSDENPNFYREHHTQKTKKLNVWAAIHIFGPILNKCSKMPYMRHATFSSLILITFLDYTLNMTNI